MTVRRVVSAVVLVGVIALAGAYGLAQEAGTPASLRAQLIERYDIVALQRGVALVPRSPDAAVRLIQIVDGVVTIDGQTVTGQELRDRLGQDADAVLRVSYLDAQAQREMAGGTGGVGAPAIAPSQPPAAQQRAQVRRGGIVRFGEGVTVGTDERVDGDVVAFGGNVTIDGEVTGDVVAFGGAVTLGPRAEIGGDLNVIGGALQRAPGARVDGDVEEVSGARMRGFRRGWRFDRMFDTFGSSLGSLAATGLRLTLLLLLGLAAVAVDGKRMEQIGHQAAAAPVRVGLIGLLGQILIVPAMVLTVVILAISIVGIPLLVLVPFAVILVILAMLAGFLGLASQLGGWLARRLGRGDVSPYAAVALGVGAIGIVTLTGKLVGMMGGGIVGTPLVVAGSVLEYVAWTVGFGAAIVAWHDARRAGRPHHAPGIPPTGPVAPPSPAPGEA